MTVAASVSARDVDNFAGITFTFTVRNYEELGEVITFLNFLTAKTSPQIHPPASPQPVKLEQETVPRPLQVSETGRAEWWHDEPAREWSRMAMALDMTYGACWKLWSQVCKISQKALSEHVPTDAEYQQVAAVIVRLLDGKAKEGKPIPRPTDAEVAAAIERRKAQGKSIVLEP